MLSDEDILRLAMDRPSLTDEQAGLAIDINSGNLPSPCPNCGWAPEHGVTVCGYTDTYGAIVHGE